jgi:hypothetical protein
LPVELLLEPWTESDRLPDEAEPALEADDAKLSARSAGDTATHSNDRTGATTSAFTVGVPKGVTRKDIAPRGKHP